MRAPLPAGFTLLELMVVLAIVGVLAALAGPSFTGLSRGALQKQDTVASQALLSEARLTARRLNRCVVVVRLDAQQLRWRTFSDASARCPDSTHDAQERTLQITAQRWRVLELQGVDDTDGRLLFLRNGATPYADRATVRVQSVGSGQIRHFDIIPATGAVRARR